MSHTVAESSHDGSPRALHLTLWAVQVLLGLAFIFAGVTKAMQPMEALAAQMPWTTVVGTGMTRFIGVAELLGGLGLLLPSLTRIQPWLTPLAGLGLAGVMALAAGFHLMRGEVGALPVNLLLGGLAAFVAWGRARRAPIASRRAPPR